MGSCVGVGEDGGGRMVGNKAGEWRGSNPCQHASQVS